MGLLEDFYDHLRSIGVEGELGKHAIRLAWCNVDLISLGETKGTTYNTGIINIDYIVNRHIGSEEQTEDWYTTIKKKREGPFLRKKVTGFEWSGGKKMGSSYVPNRISKTLNRDHDLNIYLFSRFQAGMPRILIQLLPKEVTPYFNVLMTSVALSEEEIKKKMKEEREEITRMWNIRKYISIQMRFEVGITEASHYLQLYSTRDDIQAFDTIAKHIKEV